MALFSARSPAVAGSPSPGHARARRTRCHPATGLPSGSSRRPGWGRTQASARSWASGLSMPQPGVPGGGGVVLDPGSVPDPGLRSVAKRPILRSSNSRAKCQASMTALSRAGAGLPIGWVAPIAGRRHGVRPQYSSIQGVVPTQSSATAHFFVIVRIFVEGTLPSGGGKC